MIKWYTNGIKDIKCEEGKQPFGFIPGRSSNKGKIPWNKGLTRYSDDRVAKGVEKSVRTRKDKNNYKSWNSGLTKDTDERLRRVSVKVSASRKGKTSNSISKCRTEEQKHKQSLAMRGKTPWNKGLTKETNDIIRQISEKLQGHKLILSDEKKKEAKAKEYATKKKNNSFNISSKEELLYKELCDLYGKDDIERQYSTDPRYPFNCDFYIKSKDLFIEYNGTFDHGEHPFDKNNPEDIKKLKELEFKVETYGAKSRYNNVIYIWTVRDVLKLETMRKNHLNFRILYPTISIIH